EFSIIWSGYLEPLFSEVYTFTTLTDDGVRLWVNGQFLIDHWQDHTSAWDSGTIALTAGQRVPIRMEYYKNGYSGGSQLYWTNASQSTEMMPANRVYSGAPAPPPPPPPPPSGNGDLRGLWRFNDGSGPTASDGSGLGNDGALVNGPAWTSGVSGGGLMFNGSSSVSVGASGS